MRARWYGRCCPWVELARPFPRLTRGSQIYDARQETITLLFESPSRARLELPDNLCISPQNSSLLCEDGPDENYLRGITPAGGIFDFARNEIPQRMADEFAGVTFAIWGSWEDGAL